MSMTHFVKDLRGYYGMLVVQGATQKETERFHGMPIEDIKEHSELPIGGLLRVEVHLRSEVERSFDRIEGCWVAPMQILISDPGLEGDSAVVIRDLFSEMARMMDEDRDSLKKLWAKQRLTWDAPEDPTELRQPVAEPNGEETTQKDVDGS